MEDRVKLDGELISREELQKRQENQGVRIVEDTKANSSSSLNEGKEASYKTLHKLRG
jgi:hypothetical protein